MSENLQFIRFKEELRQSQIFGDKYDGLLDETGEYSFTSPIFNDLGELLNSILFAYEGLTDFQASMLASIFDAFNEIRQIIDPSRLKSFEHFLNADGELLLFRNSESGLTNIIINPEDCIAYSFISSKGQEDGDQLRFLYSHDDDFEKLAYDFFSH